MPRKRGTAAAPVGARELSAWWYERAPACVAVGQRPWRTRRAWHHPLRLDPDRKELDTLCPKISPRAQQASFRRRRLVSMLFPDLRPPETRRRQGLKHFAIFVLDSRMAPSARSRSARSPASRRAAVTAEQPHEAVFEHIIVAPFFSGLDGGVFADGETKRNERRPLFPAREAGPRARKAGMV